MTRRQTKPNPNALDIIGFIVIVGVVVWVGSNVGKNVGQGLRGLGVLPTPSPIPGPSPGTPPGSFGTSIITLSHVDYTGYLITGSDMHVKWTIGYYGPVAQYTVGISFYNTGPFGFGAQPPSQVIELPVFLEASPNYTNYVAEAVRRFLPTHGIVGVRTYIKNSGGLVVYSNDFAGEVVIF